MTTINPDPRFIAYLYFFNTKMDYYECHEYGEHLWLEEGRPTILKGLIQAAVCLYHLHNGNLKGGYKMWLRARGYMDSSRPIYQGIHLDKLTEDIDSVFRQVPEAFFDRVVPAKEIERLKLPVVKISIVSPEIQALVDHCIPVSLD